jgi:hypothetical protein
VCLRRPLGSSIEGLDLHQMPAAFGTGTTGRFGPPFGPRPASEIRNLRPMQMFTSRPTLEGQVRLHRGGATMERSAVPPISALAPPCDRCERSGFVHGDDEGRQCLYSDCPCVAPSGGPLRRCSASSLGVAVRKSKRCFDRARRTSERPVSPPLAGKWISAEQPARCSSSNTHESAIAFATSPM